jgi:hypothetical protein
MSEMVERVARDLRSMLYGIPPQRHMDEDSLWLKVARSAIAAMREPTDAMVKASWENLRQLPSNVAGVNNKQRYFDIVAGDYRAMIDEALR